MAEVEEAIVTRLNAYSGLTALVSSRIHADVRPQGADPALLPCVTTERTSNAYVQCFADPGSLQYPTLSVTAWGMTKASAKAVARQVYAALAGWSSASSSPVVQDVRPLASGADEGFDGDDVWYVAQHFEVWYQDS